MTVYLVLMAMLVSMMADVADKRELSSGDREEGTLYSALMLTSKISSSLGVWISGLILEFVDFPVAVDAIEVAPETARSLVMVAICVFLVFYPLALFCLSRFRIDRAEHESDLDQLRNL
jgi:Na+/melibiose symporter-like transporter